MRPELNLIVESISRQLRKSGGGRWLESERVQLAESVLETNPCSAANLIELLSARKQESPNDFVASFDVARIVVRMLFVGFRDESLLLRVGRDPVFPWYVRQEAFFCLKSSPSSDLSPNFDWEKVIQAVESNETGEIRSAAMSVLVSHRIQEALPRLKAICKSVDSTDGWLGEWHDGERELQMARAALGDAEMFVAVVERSFDPWDRKRRDALAALEQVSESFGGEVNVARLLLAQQGHESDPALSPNAVWRRLQNHPNQKVARWAVAQSSGSDSEHVQNYVDLLGNPDWGIRSAACDKLVAINEGTVDEPLFDFLGNKHASQVSRSWTAWTLIRRGNSPQERTSKVLGKEDELWQVPWPFEFDDRVRQAVVAEYAFNPREGTDVRYRIEYAMTVSESSRYAESQARADRQRLMECLDAAGLPVISAQDCGDYHQQGGGTYWVLELGKGDCTSELYVSTLGPFVTYVNATRQKHEHGSAKWWGYPSNPDDIQTEKLREEMAICKDVVAQSGLLGLYGEFLEPTVPGLNVYFFGNRDPLPLRDLLFYWQD